MAMVPMPSPIRNDPSDPCIWVRPSPNIIRITATAYCLSMAEVGARAFKHAPGTPAGHVPPSLSQDIIGPRG